MESNKEYDLDWQKIIGSASSYNNEITDWSPIYDWIIPRITGAIVLDAGCGLGHLLSRLQDKRTIGIDFSQIALDVAKIRCPNSELYLCDIENDALIFDYDTICITQVLEHIQNDLKVLDKIPKEKEVFISVPCEAIAHPTHVRCFNSVEAVIDRYKHHLTVIGSVRIWGFLCVHGIKK